MEPSFSMQLFIGLCQIVVAGAITYVLYRIYLSYTRNIDGQPSSFEKKVERTHRHMVESEYKGSNTFIYDHLKISAIFFAIGLFVSLGAHAFGFVKLIPFILGGLTAPWIYVTFLLVRDRIRFNKRREWIQPAIDKKVDNLVTNFWEKE